MFASPKQVQSVCKYKNISNDQYVMIEHKQNHIWYIYVMVSMVPIYSLEVTEWKRIIYFFNKNG